MKKYSYYFYKNTVNNINIYINKVYNWVLYGLLITFFTSWCIKKIPFFKKIIFFNKLFLFTFLINQLIIIFLLSNVINKLRTNIINLLFIIYSILIGILISNIFLIYTYYSIKISFIICNIIFLIMSLLGYKSKINLTKIGNISLIFIINIIINNLINILLKSSFIIWITSYLGILSFCILISWDNQKLKEIGICISKKNKKLKKYSILGALILYLDLINLNLLNLKLIGIKKNK